MLHYYGDLLAMNLGAAARDMIFLYEKPGEAVVLVPYFDLERKKKRYVRFEKMAGISEWVYIDLQD